MDNEQAQALPEMWAVVGLFGRTKIAGKLTTQTLGSACLLRIDTPEYTRVEKKYDYAKAEYAKTTITIPAHTRFVGPSAIYDIDPCSEGTVRAILNSISPSPVQAHDINRLKLLAAPQPPGHAVDAQYPQEGDDGEDDEENYGEGPEEPMCDGAECPNCHAEDQDIVDGVICCEECNTTTPVKTTEQTGEKVEEKKTAYRSKAAY
jgi:hypothetical protein